MSELSEETRLRRIQEQRLGVRAICSTLIASFGVDAAMCVLKDEYRELVQMKSEIERPEISEEFDQAVCTSGTIRATCDFCGVTYFVSYGDYEPGELEDLRESARKEPKKYIEECRYDMIDVGYIEGKMAVLGCDCKKIASYERWIWNHRWMIAKYLKLRARTLETDAKFAKENSDDAQLAAVY